MDEQIEAYEADERARREECARLITACFVRAKEQVGELDAWTMFVQFARAALPKPWSIAHNSGFDEELLAAYDAASPGEKQDAAIAFGAQYRKPAVVTLRHLARVLVRRAAISLSPEQLRIEFNLDPGLTAIEAAKEQFASLAEGQEQIVDDDHPGIFDETISAGETRLPGLLERLNLH
jgi:hypothetical protein